MMMLTNTACKVVVLAIILTIIMQHGESHNEANLIQVQAESSMSSRSDGHDLNLIEKDAMRNAGLEMRNKNTSTSDLEEGLVADRKQLLQMKLKTKNLNDKAEHESAAREVLEGAIGARSHEQKRCYSCMSRWWRLHRRWMKRHNASLYEKLREHRALSLSTLEVAIGKRQNSQTCHEFRSVRNVAK